MSRKNGYNIKIKDKKQANNGLSEQMFAYQNDAVENLKILDEEYSDYYSTLVVIPTGGGKTRVAVEYLYQNVLNRERKINDKNRRLDRMYEELVDLEEKLADAERKRRAVERDELNLDEIYSILLKFDRLFDKMTDKEQRDMLEYLVKEIEIYPDVKRKDLSRLKSITFQFPINYGGETGDKILWDNKMHVETVVLLQRAEGK